MAILERATYLELGKMVGEEKLQQARLIIAIYHN